MVKESNQISNREVKASAFTAYFSDPKKAAELYMALTGEQVAPRDIHYTTLKGVLFLVSKNDLAFTVKDKVLVISEHQSKINDNMPLRNAIYYGRMLEQCRPLYEYSWFIQKIKGYIGSGNSRDEALQRYPEKNDADICAMLQAGQN